MKDAGSPSPHETPCGPGAAVEHVAVGPLGAFPAGVGRAVEAVGRDLAIFNVDGELVALDGRCLHRAGPLAEGFVRDGIVTCPMHWWRYDIRSGRCLSATGSLRRYPLRIVDGNVILEVEPAEVRDGAHAGESIRDRLLRLAREWAVAADRDTRS